MGKISKGFRAQAIFLTLALAFFAATGAGAQQITRVAVLDLARVLAAFPQETLALKNFETRKAEVQAAVDRASAEIKSLAAQKAQALSANWPDEAARLDSEIATKTAALKEYATARQNELDLLSKALSSPASFLQKLNSTIASVAEAEGYSLVLNLKPQEQNSNIVLWNSPSVDLTDKVIQSLQSAR